MRKLISHILLTLDGTAVFNNATIEAIVGLRDAEVEADFSAHLAAEDAMLLGRMTYSEWAGYWPTSSIEPFASHVNSVPKHVVSRTLSSVPWGTKENASLLSGSLVDAVTNLKRSSGKHIGVHGSPTLVESLLHANLLDELRLELYPIIAGTGARLFREGRELKHMELMRSMVSASGVVVLTYKPKAPAAK